MTNDIDLDYELALEILDEIKDDPMGAWFTLPEDITEPELMRFRDLSKNVNDTSAFLVCIGVGGSYLGTRAVYEALLPIKDAKTKLLFAGNSLSSGEIEKVLAEIGDQDFSINVISKSGTTLESSIAYRIFKQKLIEKYGEDGARRRIYITTDPASGALRLEAVRDGLVSFDIPLGVGGRYSVLSAVGLFPLCVAGVDIKELLAGAIECKRSQTAPDKIRTSTLVSYAFTRFYLYDEEKCDVEVLASFEPRLMYFNEWWKQLFGESEGKDGQGIFPASVIYSTDLHSLGQYLQDGRRNIFETFLRFSAPKTSLTIPPIHNATDGLDYLEGERLSDISDKALEATIRAHDAGGISTIEIEVTDPKVQGITAKTMGFLIFFFETACAISAMLHGVDPFNQPGVEAYKREMYRLLRK